MDLQLDVKGCKDVYASFAKYTEVEMLDGQNQYKAEGHGLQVRPTPAHSVLHALTYPAVHPPGIQLPMPTLSQLCQAAPLLMWTSLSNQHA